MNQSTLDRITALESAVSTLTGDIQGINNALKSLSGSMQTLNNSVQEISDRRATTGSYGLAKVSESTTVTDNNNGLVLSAKEKNASINGTIMNLVNKKFSETKKMQEYRYFSEIPEPNYEYNFCIVLNSGGDNDAPVKEVAGSVSWWWNVIDFGIPGRRTQIAFSAFRRRDEIFIRQKHDANWIGWYSIKGTIV